MVNIWPFPENVLSAAVGSSAPIKLIRLVSWGRWRRRQLYGPVNCALETVNGWWSCHISNPYIMYKDEPWRAPPPLPPLPPMAWHLIMAEIIECLKCMQFTTETIRWMDESPLKYSGYLISSFSSSTFSNPHPPTTTHCMSLYRLFAAPIPSPHHTTSSWHIIFSFVHHHPHPLLIYHCLCCSHYYTPPAVVDIIIIAAFYFICSIHLPDTTLAPADRDHFMSPYSPLYTHVYVLAVLVVWIV